MTEHLRHLSAAARIPISCLPNAGLPSVVDGQMHYDLSAPQLCEHHKRFVTELGVSIIGGCCGTTPDHIRCIADSVKGVMPRVPPERPKALRLAGLEPFELA